MLSWKHKCPSSKYLEPVKVTSFGDTVLMDDNELKGTIIVKKGP